MVARLLLLFTICAAKYVSLSLIMSEVSQWKYLTKFAMDQGVGHFSIRIRFSRALDHSNATRTLALPVVQDTRWDEVLSQETCTAKRRLARFEEMVRIPTSGEWSEYVNGTLKQSARPYYWFFSLADCDRVLHDSHRLKVELTMLNTDESHFSMEEQGLGYVYLLFFLAFAACFSSALLSLWQRFQKTEGLEPASVLQGLAVGVEISGMLFEALHLWVYAYDGSGIAVFDYFHQAGDLTSQLLVTMLLMLISTGWILRYAEFPDLDISLPIALLVALLNLMIAGLGRLSDDSYGHFTDYEGLAGTLLLLLRLGMWVWFAFNMRSLLSSAQPQEQSVIWSLSLTATLYFLSLPALVLASWTVAPYFRKKVVVIGGLTIQLAVFLLLARLLSERSAFYKASTMSGSTLPGGRKFR